MNTRLCAIILVCLQGAAQADRVDDRAFGFSFEVPDGFKPFPEAQGKVKDALHGFVLGNPMDTEADVVLHVRRLRGTFPITQLLTSAELAKANKPTGMTMEVHEIPWSGHTLAMMRTSTSLPDGREFVGYSVQYPLLPEAIEVVVGGLKDREQDLKRFAEAVVAGFRGDRINLGAVAPGISVAELSPAARREKMIDGLANLTLCAMAVALVLALLLGKKKSPPPTPPGPA